MKKTPVKFLLLALVVIVQACNSPTDVASEPPATEAVVTEPPISPTEAEVPAEIIHTTIPVSLPVKSSAHAGDQDSSRTAGDFTAPGGDRFTFGEYERPFNSVAMDVYFPDIDILFYEIFEDDTWVYVSITVHSSGEKGNLPRQYALEIDNDIDGKGDFLVITSAPSIGDWTTNSVQIWQDTNKDVGGVEPVVTDKVKGAFFDGFETNIFDNGVGNDPDSAWSRIAPENPLIVQIAVKRAVVDDDGKFLAGPWSGTLIDPGRFDFNDIMTPEEAGAAIKSFTLYPIQQLAEMDNACRVPIGILVSATTLGLCEDFEPTPEPGEVLIDPGSPPTQPPPTCPNCIIP